MQPYEKLQYERFIRRENLETNHALAEQFGFLDMIKPRKRSIYWVLEKILRIGDFEKLSFFELAILELNIFFFASFPWKSVNVSCSTDIAALIKLFP